MPEDDSSVVTPDTEDEKSEDRHHRQASAMPIDDWMNI